MSAPYVVPYDCLFEGPLTDEAKRRGFRDIIFEPNPKQSPGAGAHLCAVPTCNVVAYDMPRCKRHQQEVDAAAEPPAPDDNLPKAGTDLFVGHEFSGAGLKNPCLVCGGSFFARQHRLRIDTCVACRNPIIDGVDHPECIAKLSAKEQEERARLVGGSRTPNTPEPAPKPGVARATWSLVMADMLERDAAGAAKYGIRHQHDNGRDHLVDAYQEALDLALYLRAEIEKRKGNLVGGAQ